MSFFGSLFGSDQRKDIKQANKQATGQLAEGYGQQQQRYDQAYDIYDPYAKQGQAANAFYGNALGLNGADAQNQSIQTLTSNPLFQGQLGQDSNALARMLNARGQSGGGLANMAAQRVFQQTAGNWLDRYRDQGEQGLQVAGDQSRLRAAQGDNAMGYGATRAGQAVNYGNAMAQSRNIGINNLTGLLGAGIGGYNALYNKPKV